MNELCLGVMVYERSDAEYGVALIEVPVDNWKGNGGPGPFQYHGNWPRDGDIPRAICTNESIKAF